MQKTLNKSYICRKLPKGVKIKIDGKLNEPIWKELRSVGPFEFPWAKKGDLRQSTVAKLCWDDDYLYLGYHANDISINQSGGAGIQAAQLIISQGVKAVLTGNVGPNAFQGLNAGKIGIYTGISGSIKDAIALYKTGKLKATLSATASSKSGMKDLNK